MGCTLHNASATTTKCTVSQRETCLAKKPTEPSRETLSWDDTLRRVQKERAYHNSVAPFYHLMKHRRLRMTSSTLRDRANHYVINKFKRDRRITDPSKAVVIFGDYNNWGGGLKGTKCNKGKGFCDLFSRAGFPVYYIWEAYTSKMCALCMDSAATMSKFLPVWNPKVKKRTAGERKRLCHGLLQCSQCHVRFDRDANAAMNIRELGLSLIYEWHNTPGGAGDERQRERQRYRPAYLRTIPRAGAAAAGAAAAVPGAEDDGDGDEDIDEE